MSGLGGNPFAQLFPSIEQAQEYTNHNNIQVQNSTTGMKYIVQNNTTGVKYIS